jgi:uncharacterized protein YbbK (DUF523 family)
MIKLLMKLCSACLLGVECRYDGASKANDKVLELAKTETLIPVCPEQLGGLSTPRPPAEQNNDRVITRDGEEVTLNFQKGAGEVLKIAKLLGIDEAILKQGSPSCGNGRIYDGTFSGIKIIGDGVTTKLLRQNGIKVVSEEDL